METLKSEASRRIVERLAGGQPHPPAYQSERCLACHSSATPTRRAQSTSFTWNSRGVGCEACHGQPDKWLHQHYGWAELAATEKERRFDETRMTWLRDVDSRARACVGCHVGAPATETAPLRDVDHDLIAAGHPRLNFELHQYLKALPPHWIEKNTDPALPARTWAAGQWIAAESSLALLADRAVKAAEPSRDDMDAAHGVDTLSLNPKRAWPELSEMNCFACHHDLKVESGRSSRGLPVWGNAPTFLLDEAALLGNAELQRRLAALGADLDDLRTQVQKFATPPDEVHRRASTLHAAFTQQRFNALSHEDDPSIIEGAIRSVLEKHQLAEHRNWDQSAQTYLALTALMESSGARKLAIQEQLDELFRQLAFPHGYNSPNSFSTAGVEQAISQLKQQLANE